MGMVYNVWDSHLGRAVRGPERWGVYFISLSSMMTSKLTKGEEADNLPPTLIV